MDYYGIESTVRGDMIVDNVIKLNLNESVPFLEYKVKYRIFNVRTESEYAPVECDTKVTDTTVISCTFSDSEDYDTTKLKIEFEAREMTRQVDENYDFSHFVGIEDDVKTLFHVIYLPETAVLLEDDSFSPKYGEILSDGRHIIISWDRSDMEKGDDVYFTVNYKMPVAGLDLWSIGIMLVIVIIIITSFGVFYIKTTKKHGSIKVIMPLLKGDEKIVVDVLIKHEGSINQRVIVRESDFSKAKVSRLVAGLKERGIVDVEVLGRSNKVTLKVKK